ncbi:MAG: hypothetical protein KTR31_02020 [Myxococcales bacterium]|nr:hypothetical protein [Myxococcales bacterium]
MRLQLAHVPGFVRLAVPDADEATIQGALQQAQDPAWRALRAVEVTDDGAVRAAAWVRPVGHRYYMLRGPRVAEGQPLGKEAAELVASCVQGAHEQGARLVEARVVDAAATPQLAEVYEAAGGQRQAGRIEFRTPMGRLPSEAGSPMAWRAATSLTEAATVFGRVVRGALDGVERQGAPIEVLRSYLGDPDMVRDLAACAHIGSHRGRAVAFVCAQTHLRSSWCTITYLGLVPEVRGTGLGHWVHKHGIAMLRAQGGQLYHGGTGLDNAPMRACFARQRCKEYRRFAVWHWLSD